MAYVVHIPPMKTSDESGGPYKSGAAPFFRSDINLMHIRGGAEVDNGLGGPQRKVFFVLKGEKTTGRLADPFTSWLSVLAKPALPRRDLDSGIQLLGSNIQFARFAVQKAGWAQTKSTCGENFKIQIRGRL